MIGYLAQIQLKLLEWVLLKASLEQSACRRFCWAEVVADAFSTRGKSTTDRYIEDE